MNIRLLITNEIPLIEAKELQRACRAAKFPRPPRGYSRVNAARFLTQRTTRRFDLDAGVEVALSWQTAVPGMHPVDNHIQGWITRMTGVIRIAGKPHHKMLGDLLWFSETTGPELHAVLTGNDFDRDQIASLGLRKSAMRALRSAQMQFAAELIRLVGQHIGHAGNHTWLQCVRYSAKPYLIAQMSTYCSLVVSDSSLKFSSDRFVDTMTALDRATDGKIGCSVFDLPVSKSTMSLVGSTLGAVIRDAVETFEVPDKMTQTRFDKLIDRIVQLRTHATCIHDVTIPTCDMASVIERLDDLRAAVEAAFDARYNRKSLTTEPETESPE